MSPSLLPDWAAAFAWLAAEAALVILAATTAQPFLGSATARRSLWRAVFVALALLCAAEFTGLTGQATVQLRAALEDLRPRPARIPEAPASPIPLILPPLPSLAPTGGEGRGEGEPAPSDFQFQPEPSLPPASSSLSHSPTFSPALALALTGTALLLARLAFTQLGFALLRLRHFTRAAAALEARVRELAARLGLRRPVRVLASLRLRAPAAFGWLRPTVGVPDDFTARFTAPQRDVMLAHELAHLAARDPLWQLLADLVAAALWWHPLAWVARRQHRAAAEQVADEASLVIADGPVTLAECLLALGREATADQLGALGMAGLRSGLGRRVERLLALPRGEWQTPSRARLALQTTAALLALAAVALLPGCAANRTAGEAPSRIVAHWWQAKTKTPENQPRGATLLIKPQPKPAIITGRVVFNGTPPAERDIPLPPNVQAARTNAPLKTRFHRVSPDGGLADVLVYVKLGLTNLTIAAPTNTFVVRADSYEFEPYIGAIQAGQTVRWESRLASGLNINPTPTNRENREFNFTLMTNRPVEARFTGPELFLRVKTDVFPWMFHYLSVIEHPYFAVTDAEGHFRFPQPLPPGRYTLAAVHRQAGESVQELDLTQPLPAGQPPEIQFVLPGQSLARYVVSVGDELLVTVYLRDDLRTQMKVLPSGRIVLPLVGVVQVAGKTISEVRDAIRDAYQPAHLETAHVTVTLVQSAPQLAPLPQPPADFTPSTSPTREELLERRSRVVAEIKAAGQTYLPTHAKMVGLRKQLESVEEALKQIQRASFQMEVVRQRLAQLSHIEKKLQNPSLLLNERLMLAESTTSWVPSSIPAPSSPPTVEERLRDAERRMRLLKDSLQKQLASLSNTVASGPQAQLNLSPPPAASVTNALDISVGRQLFVDDFLIASNTLQRTWHQPVLFSATPLLAVHDQLPPLHPFFESVWFDATNQLFMLGLARGRTFVHDFHSPSGTNWVSMHSQSRSGAAMDILVPPRTVTTDYESLRISLSRETETDGIRFGFARGGAAPVPQAGQPVIPLPMPADGSSWIDPHPLRNGFLVVGRNLYFYFGGHVTNYGPRLAAPGFHQRQAAVGLATLRRDGFASLDAGPEGGVLTTKPVQFTGRFMFVNFKTNALDGEMRVELLDADGNAIERFSRANCIPLAADQTLMGVSWQNGALDLSSLVGKPVRFRFHLKNASLYSFWVGPGQLGRSLGRVAGGGPHFTNDVDTIGNRSYQPLPVKAGALAVGDYLRWEVTYREGDNERTLRAQGEVASAGYIPLPRVKQAVVVAGKTIEEAQDSIRAGFLAAGFPTTVVKLTKIAPPPVAPKASAPTNAPAALHHQPTVEKLAAIRIKEVQFDGLPLSEVLKMLETDTRKNDPAKQGVSFGMLSVENITQFIGYDSVPPKFAGEIQAQSVGSGTVGVTLTATVPLPQSRVRQIAIRDMDLVLVHVSSVLRDVSVLDVLDAIVKTAGAPIGYTVETNRVVFRPRLAGREWVGPRVGTNAPGAAVRALAEKIVLPVVQYDGLPLPEVIKLLTADARKHDPAGRGVNFLVTSRYPDASPVKGMVAVRDQQGNPIPGAGMPPPAPDLDIAIIRLGELRRDQTLRQTLDAICAAANPPITYRFEDYGILITPRFPDAQEPADHAAQTLGIRADRLLTALARELGRDAAKLEPTDAILQELLVAYFAPRGFAPPAFCVADGRVHYTGLRAKAEEFARLLYTLERSVPAPPRLVPPKAPKADAAPSPFAEGGEKVAEGRLRGAATNADAANPSPQPSPLAAQRTREPERAAPLLPATQPTPAPPGTSRTINAALAREHCDRLEALVKTVRTNPATTAQDYANVTDLIEQALTEYAAVLPPNASELVRLNKLLNKLLEETKRTAPKPGASVPVTPPGTYTVGVGDKLRIQIQHRDELTVESVVRSEGDLFLVLVRSVPVAGKTLDAVRETLRTSYQSLRQASWSQGWPTNVFAHLDNPVITLTLVQAAPQPQPPDPVKARERTDALALSLNALLANPSAEVVEFARLGELIERAQIEWRDSQDPAPLTKLLH